METDKIIQGKRILVVDDEEDILEVLVDLLDICKIDTASSFEEAKKMIDEKNYDIAVLDIMGVNGYELVKIANSRRIPSLMLTAHALSSDSMKLSAEAGAAYYAPKDKIENIRIYIADVLVAIEKDKSPWEKMFSRLCSFYDEKFGGTDWREKEKEFWKNKMKERLR